MMELIEANWPLLLVALLIGLIVAWFLFAANRRTGVTTDRRDVLDEDGTKAGRNQALIDSAPAARRDTPLAQEPVTRPASAAATAPPTKAAQREIVEPRDVPVRPVTPVAGAGLASPGSAAEAVASEVSETPVGQSGPVTREEISTQPAPAPEPAQEEAATQEATDEIAPMPDPDAADDLTRIKGLGPKLNAALAVLGVTRFDQIASWDDAEIDRVDAQLGRFAGRIRRDDWVEQARLLAANDMDSYQDRFGRL